MIYANAPLFHNPTGWLPGSLMTVPGGVVMSLPDGDVLSVQPDGRFETRPGGTAGPYEVAQQKGDKLVYSTNGTIYVVPMVVD